MSRLVVAAAVASLFVASSCGGPLEEDQSPAAAASQTAMLNSEVPPPVLVPSGPPGPSQILGVEQTLQFDFSDGRFNAVLTAPPDEARAFYQAMRTGSGGGCHH